jgi:ABC-2 type transport system permease protein
MRKLLAIAWKEIAARFSDPVVLLLTIAMPLAVTALIDLAFGDLVLGRGIPDMSFPVGLVNLDRGSRWGNFGQLLVRALIPEEGQEGAASTPGVSLFDLFDSVEIEDEAEARWLVERQKLFASLLIPPDFSETLLAEDAVLRVVINGDEEMRGLAFKSAVAALANKVSSAEIAVHTTVRGLSASPSLRAQLESGKLDDTLADLALAATTPETNPLQVEFTTLAQPQPQVELTRVLAAAMAVLFTGFTVLMGSASLLQERAQGTLQRIFITPTRMGLILAGKGLGTYLNGVIQLVAVAGGVAVLQGLRGSPSPQGPATDLPALLLLVLTVAAAATGFALVIAALARTYARASNYGRGLLILMGLAGGIFFPVDLFPPPFDLLSRATFHYWALDGYMKLARGGDAGTILSHLLVLGAMAVVFFGVGSWLLRRRLEAA